MSSSLSVWEEVKTAKSHNPTKFTDFKFSTLPQLKEQNFVDLTLCQALSYPHILQGKDVAVQSKTGTGKTLAFLVPALEILTRKGGNLLVFAPTHELAIQIHDVLKTLTELPSATVMGGGKKPIHVEGPTIEAKNPRFIVATPGRLYDHLNSGNLKKWVAGVKMLVFDEADRMHDMGFSIVIGKIYAFLPENMQTMLFSATLAPAVLRQARLKPGYTSLSTVQENEANVNEECIQDYFVADHDTVLGSLATLIKQNKGKKILVFFHTGRVVQWVAKCFEHNKISALPMFGKMGNSARARTIQSFTDSSSIVLFATDVIARGMDIPDVDLVIQVGTPSEVSEYVHRIGRTSRAGKAGRAVLILTPSELPFLKKLESTNVQLKKISAPTPAPFELIHAGAARAFTTEIGYLINQLKEDQLIDTAVAIRKAWGVQDIEFKGMLASQLTANFYTALGLEKKTKRGKKAANRRARENGEAPKPQGQRSGRAANGQAESPRAPAPQPQNQSSDSNGNGQKKRKNPAPQAQNPSSESNGQKKPKNPAPQQQNPSGEQNGERATTPKKQRTPRPQKPAGESSNGQAKSPKPSGESSNGRAKSPNQPRAKKPSGESNGDAKPKQHFPQPSPRAQTQSKRPAENGSAEVGQGSKRARKNPAASQ